MELAAANVIAGNLVVAMRPYCERVEIAGSIRRLRPEVKDIEIVAIPKWEERPDPNDLFQEDKVSINLLFEHWAGDDSVTWIKPGVPDIVRWPLNANGKYWRGYLEEHNLKLDLFLCCPENWGVIFTIRTGSAEFSHELAAWAQKRNTPIKDGYLTNFGSPINSPEEHDVFDFLGLKYIWPQLRNGREAIIPV